MEYDFFRESGFGESGRHQTKVEVIQFGTNRYLIYNFL